jgi:hypothetical protein
MDDFNVNCRQAPRQGIFVPMTPRNEAAEEAGSGSRWSAEQEPGGDAVTEPITEASPRPKARIIGIVYLLYFLTAVLAVFFMKGLVVSADAAATASNLLAHEPRFRLGFAVGLIANAWYLALTALFYDLFKPVSRSLSLIAAFFSLVGCAIQTFGSLFQLAPFVVLGSGSQYLSVFKVEQLQALALMFLKLHSQAFNIGLVFFAFYCLLIGYLILRSDFLPRILGVLMVLAGLGWLTFLSPPLANYLSRYIQVFGFLAEVSLMLWLLVMGVDARPQASRRRPG